jgi:microsomal epoxide hydrolase
VDVPQATINRIIDRVKQGRLPDRLDAPDWRYGANWSYMKSLVDYWVRQFDWKKAQANLNRYPQFLARVADYDVHFYYVKGEGPKPFPLILTHGWPGSVFEFLDAIGPLSSPSKYGGSPEDAFDVVIPSIPGFGFSSKPTRPIGPPTAARLWHTLMTGVLGYSKFGAQGGDWGNAITVALAREFPQSLAGIHLNATGGGAAGESHGRRASLAAGRDGVSDAGSGLFQRTAAQARHGGVCVIRQSDRCSGVDYREIQSVERLGREHRERFTKDQLLTNVMIYLVTDTVATAIWFYRGAADDPAPRAQGKVEVPTGFASFPGENDVIESAAQHPRTQL